MQQENLEVMRHSVAHLMAAAVRQYFAKEVKFGIGPAIETGCYYDFILPRTITPEDLAQIDKLIQKLIKAGLVFEREEMAFGSAVEYFEKNDQPFKLELISELNDKQEVISLYHLKDPKTKEIIFTDLCKGPHVETAGELKGLGIKCDKFSSAYWRGDQERGIDMQRLYALVYPTPEDLDQFIEMREEAVKRDHRTLGRDLELFFFHDTAPGVPYWMPKGLTIKNLLIQYWRQYHLSHGYQEFSGPLLNKKEMWEISGHWDHYQEDMFKTITKSEDVWALKPMSCPNAINCYSIKNRSYRELPLRFCDVDTLHRDEIPGALHGLMRARSFMQDDSHNFIMESQIKEEIQSILNIVKDFYKVFGLEKNVKLFLSTRPDDFMGDIESWNKAEEDLKAVLDASEFDYGIKEKDGAFYGPKIDIHLSDALNREWQCGTVQLDFQLPKNFDLKYTAEDGKEEAPVIIHRVIYGSLERFIGILIEHFAGRLPFWIAPVQVRILTINDQMGDYVERVSKVLSETVLHEPVKYNELRFDVDDRSESLGKKIREAEMTKIPVIIIVGPKDLAEEQVSLRIHNEEKKVRLADLSQELSKA